MSRPQFALATRPADPAEAGALAQREPVLDGVRGLAILLVVLFHATRFEPAASPAARAMTAIPLLGYTGVDLFFVLSGFLITGILLRTRASGRYYRTFYARRFLRIFPLYYAVLAFFTWIGPNVGWTANGQRFVLMPPLEGAAWYWAYLSNVRSAWLGATRSMMDVAWSLAIEEHFYLLWPWVVRRAGERRLLRVCTAIAAGALALRAAAVAAGTNPLVPYMLTPCRVDSLAIGAALAVVAARKDGLAALAPASRVALPLAGVAIAGLALWSHATLPAAASGAAPDAVEFSRRPAMLTIGLTLIAVFYAALLVNAATSAPESPLSRLFSSAPMRTFGKYSYAIYLLHLPVAVAVQQLFGASQFARSYATTQLAVWMLTLAGTLALAALSWFALESRFLRLKRRLPYAV